MCYVGIPVCRCTHRGQRHSLPGVSHEPEAKIAASKPPAIHFIAILYTGTCGDTQLFPWVLGIAVISPTWEHVFFSHSIFHLNECSSVETGDTENHSLLQLWVYWLLLVAMRWGFHIEKDPGRLRSRGSSALPSRSMMPLRMSSLYLLRTRHQAYSNCVLLDTEPAACSDWNFLSKFCR